MLRLSFVLIALLLVACDKPLEPPAPPRPALVMTAGDTAASSGMGLVGEVRPRYDSAQGFRIAGKIIERKVEIGSVVHKGQVLARLDPTDTGLTAQASLADVRAVEADHALAEAELDRQRQLYARKFISRSALDIREAQFKSASARLQQAQSQAAVSGNQSRYTLLLAERDGVVSDIHAEPGQVVSAGEVIAHIADLKQLEVLLAVPESRMNAVKAGDSAIIRMWASRETKYQGKIREIAPAADDTTRTFQVRVSIVDADQNVRIGMTAGVRLSNEDDTALIIPSTALTQRNGKSVVWVVDAKTHQVQPRNVVAGVFREDGVLITSGLAAGEEFVTLGVHTLVPGQVVRIMQAGVAP